MKNFLLTCDLIGKIKLVEFPNVYKMPNVFLYNDEEIKFCDFLNNQNIIVITSNYEVHLWSLFDFQLKNKFDLKNILELKVTKKPELPKKKDKDNDNEKKVYDNSQDHFSFLRDDENFKDINFIQGNKILFEIRPNISKNSESFLCLEVSNDDIISQRKLNKLNNIKMEDNFYLNLDNEREEILILNLQQENNKLDLI